MSIQNFQNSIENQTTEILCNQRLYIASPIMSESNKLITTRIQGLLHAGFLNNYSVVHQFGDYYFPAEEVDKNRDLSHHMIAHKMTSIIETSDVVTAFHPELSQGVCYEIGFAKGMGIPVQVYRFGDMLDDYPYSPMLPPYEIIWDQGTEIRKIMSDDSFTLEYKKETA